MNIYIFRSYGSILSLLRTLRILRLLKIAFRFTQVRIVFLALSRSVKLIFHVILLTIVLTTNDKSIANHIFDLKYSLQSKEIFVDIRIWIVQVQKFII